MYYFIVMLNFYYYCYNYASDSFLLFTVDVIPQEDLHPDRCSDCGGSHYWFDYLGFCQELS